jgi:hypothetical protein
VSPPRPRSGSRRLPRRRQRAASFRPARPAPPPNPYLPVLCRGNPHNFGTLTIDHSTLSGNRADRGGIYNSGGPLTLDYSTVTDNSAAVGADLHNLGGTYTLNHSKVGVIFG